MAKAGQCISNRVTGEKITWIETANDTGGQRLVFDFSVAPTGKLPVVHFHPNQSETFEVKSGVICIKFGKEIKEYKAGDRVVIEKGVSHQWWNPSSSVETNLLVTFEPALNTETFLEQFFGLNNDQLTKSDGTPKFLQIMAMANKYQIYVSGPPLLIQKIMSTVLGSIARLIGYKSYYKKYSEF